MKNFLNRNSLFAHIPLSLIMCFVLEWLSRHSFLGACSFVVDHTGAYLYNSFLIFVCYTLCYITKKQTFMRMVISAIFVTLGIVNCIVLINRVTPFGFTDLSMISDLLTMQNTNYFSFKQFLLSAGAIGGYTALMILLFIKGKSLEPRFPYWCKILLIVVSFASVPVVTDALQETGVISSYFGNLAQGYRDNGYIYGFATSVFDRGMKAPFMYSDENVDKIVEETSQGPSTLDTKDAPNIVVVLLESYFDVSECNFLETSEDPIPYFHYLEKNYSTGHLTVPVVGAGTCNTEFEVLTGMSCSFFGPGEYPQKTILKQNSCPSLESFASDLRHLGYSSHVVHNNGGNFYSRANAFSKMGFDTFQSKEMLDITDYTPMGSWPTDEILVDATVNAMKSTESADFIYTITVQTHGDYPTTKYEDDNAITTVANGKTEAQNNSWNYYVNRLHDEDKFLKEFIDAIDATGEDTLVIMFGDHLPTMGLTEDEVATGDLYKTKYITWNNFDMPKEDCDLTSYQLVAEYFDRLGIHQGTMTNYNQAMLHKNTKAGTHVYMNDLEMLQYDLLYGKRYAYNGKDLYPATDLEMGIADVVINRAYAFNGNLHIYGENFTKWSNVYVNGSKVDTTYHSGQCLSISLDDIENGDTITVCQLGSSNTIFRQSNSCKIYLKELDEDGNVKMENTGDVFIPSTSIQDAETEEH